MKLGPWMEGCCRVGVSTFWGPYIGPTHPRALIRLVCVSIYIYKFFNQALYC